jgi:hypothetical protein
MKCRGQTWAEKGLTELLWEVSEYWQVMVIQLSVNKAMIDLVFNKFAKWQTCLNSAFLEEMKGNL